MSIIRTIYYKFIIRTIYYTFITRTSERLSPINYCFCPSSRINAPKSFAITSAFNSESVN